MEIGRAGRAALAAAVLGAVLAAVPGVPAAAAPGITVEPTTPLRDRQRVTVTLTDVPQRSLLLQQCRTGATTPEACDEPFAGGWFAYPPGSAETSQRDHAGAAASVPGALRRTAGGSAVTATVPERSAAFTPVFGDGPQRFTVDASIVTADGTRVDCRPTPGACSLVVRDLDRDDAPVLASTPLTFDAAAPLAPAPTAALEPAGGLVDEQAVRLTGRGFRRDDFVLLFQCAAPTGPSTSCRSEPAGFADGEGRRISGDLAVEATFTTRDGRALDCRQPGSCAVVAGSPLELEEAGVAPLVLDPAGALAPPPRLTAEPSAGLATGQAVRLRGSSFERGFGLDGVYQCPVGALDAERCRTLDDARIRSGGGLDQTVRVTNVLRTGGTVTDCRSAPGCVVAVGALDDPDDLGVAPVAFDPSAPLAKPARLRLDPATGLRDGDLVTVRGLGFLPSHYTYLAVCAVGAPDLGSCDEDAIEEVEIGPKGRFTTQIAVSQLLQTEGGEIDCRPAGACEVVVDAFFDGPGNSVGRPLAFSTAPPRRYLDPVFDEVEVTRDIRYATAIGADGRPVDLRLDVYEPAGDPVRRRPAVVWMFGGGFVSGSKESMAEDAEAMARRGYVGVSIQYRLSPATDGAAIQRAYEDGRSAVRWLREHAAEYGIARRAIAAGGYSAGAFTAVNLAQAGRPDPDDRSRVGAVISKAGARSIGVPERGEAPLLMFHGDRDTTVPYDQAVGTCTATNLAGVRCRLVTFPGAGHGLDVPAYMNAEAARFLHRRLLVPEGVAS